MSIKPGHRRSFTVCAAIVLMILISSCGTEKQGEPSGPTAYLPAAIEEANISRTSEIRTFVGDSLWEYINGGAELYHQYGFETVATADYTAGENELVLDVYDFSDPINAYGLYTSVRPGDPSTISLGIEGFEATGELAFVKGEHFVRLTAYNPGAERAMRQLAEQVARVIPGDTARPTAFDLFPENNRIPYSDRVYAQSFLGQAFLTDFFSQDYVVGADTVMLFLSSAIATDKFDEWMDVTEPSEDIPQAPEAVPFTQDSAFTTETFHGTVVGGKRGNYLVGMVNYTADKSAFLAEWISSLPE